MIKKFKLSEIQSDAILNMRLGSLNRINEDDTKKEIKKLNK